MRLAQGSWAGHTLLGKLQIPSVHKLGQALLPTGKASSDAACSVRCQNHHSLVLSQHQCQFKDRGMNDSSLAWPRHACSKTGYGLTEHADRLLGRVLARVWTLRLRAAAAAGIWV